jgi:proline dehydrogenase
MPVSAGIVRRYVRERPPGAVTAAAALVADGLLVTLDHLGEDTLDEQQATGHRDGVPSNCWRSWWTRPGAAPRSRSSCPRSGWPSVAAATGSRRERAHHLPRRPQRRHHGDLDMEDHTTTDSTLAILRELRKDFPETGAVLQAYLHRTEADCRSLVYEGSRVRLCKGAYD